MTEDKISLLLHLLEDELDHRTDERKTATKLGSDIQVHVTACILSVCGWACRLANVPGDINRDDTIYPCISVTLNICRSRGICVRKAVTENPVPPVPVKVHFLQGETEAPHGWMLGEGHMQHPGAPPPSPRAPLTVFQATASHLGLRPRGRLWGQCQGKLRLQAVGQWWPHLGRLQRWLGLRRPRVRSAGGLSGRRER